MKIILITYIIHEYPNMYWGRGFTEPLLPKGFDCVAYNIIFIYIYTCILYIYIYEREREREIHTYLHICASHMNQL